MVRHLTTLILGGILGSMVLVGNAEACHRKNCGHVAPPVCPAPMVCVQRRFVLRQLLACKRWRIARPRSSAARSPCPSCACPSSVQKKSYCPPPVVVACATPVYYSAPVGYTYPALRHRLLVSAETSLQPYSADLDGSRIVHVTIVTVPHDGMPPFGRQAHFRLARLGAFRHFIERGLFASRSSSL